MEPRQARPTQPQLALWFDRIAEIRGEVEQLTRGLSANQLQWRPGPKKWSVVECLDHLVVTARAGGTFQRAAVERAIAAGIRGSGPYQLGLLGGWFTKLVGPAPKRPVSNPAVFAPRANLEPAFVTREFGETQVAIQDLISRCEGLAIDRITARSAVTPLLRLNLAAWIASTVAHEQRHLDQARRVKTDPAFPTR